MNVKKREKRAKKLCRQQISEWISLLPIYHYIGEIAPVRRILWFWICLLAIGYNWINITAICQLACLMQSINYQRLCLLVNYALVRHGSCLLVKFEKSQFFNLMKSNCWVNTQLLPFEYINIVLKYSTFATHVG